MRKLGLAHALPRSTTCLAGWSLLSANGPSPHPAAGWLSRRGERSPAQPWPSTAIVTPITAVPQLAASLWSKLRIFICACHANKGSHRGVTEEGRYCDEGGCGMQMSHRAGRQCTLNAHSIAIDATPGVQHTEHRAACTTKALVFGVATIPKLWIKYDDYREMYILHNAAFAIGLAG
jgi:hypothetical protein